MAPPTNFSPRSPFIHALSKPTYHIDNEINTNFFDI